MKLNENIYVEEFENSEIFTLKASNLLVSKIQDSIQNRGKAFIALSGGSTPQSIFNQVAEKLVNQLNCTKVNIFGWMKGVYRLSIQIVTLIGHTKISLLTYRK